MKHCIPDELFNRIDIPSYGADAVGLDSMFREVRYKLHMAPDVTVMKELWHSTCDFCARTGGLLERAEGTGGSCAIEPRFGRFLRLVGAGTASGRTRSMTVADNYRHVMFSSDESNYIIYSVQPNFSDESFRTDGDERIWTPTVPKWFVEKYGECIVHGALARLFAMASKQWNDINQAKMHAVAYNNDMDRLSFGLVTSGMRKFMLIDVEDWILNPVNGRN